MTEILDDRAVSEIESRPFGAMNVVTVDRVLLTPAERDALCRTVKHLRAQYDSLKSQVAWHRDGVGPDVPLDSDSRAAGFDVSLIARQFIQRYYNEGAWKDKADAWLFSELTKTLNDVATAMRDKCVEKVKEIHEGRLKDLRSLVEKGEVEHEDAEYERAVLFVLSNVIDALQSLTLDQVKPGEM